MKRYKLVNNVCGWVSFVVAAITYLSTIEPSASFWDCSEFIATSYKFEVGHPPGAPFFALTAKFFSLFASDPAHVAKMVNSMSALLSAMTILFLFWTITHLLKKVIHTDKTKEMSLAQTMIVMAGGLVGALAYTFTDTFWFSAVEGEVYAYSSMFTALVFWLILKWENNYGKGNADKWLILIAYMMGLSIGVHLLNLLCIPAIVLIYYFKTVEKTTIKGTILSLIGSFVLLVFVMYGVIPGFTKVGGWFELFFVNTLGSPYNTGAIIYLLVLILSIIWALFESNYKKGSLTRAKIAFVIAFALSGLVFVSGSWLIWVILIAALIVFVAKDKKRVTFRFLNTSVLCLLMILIGYSSFASIPIRSYANPPLDEDSPENVFSFSSYLSREQYGDSPLFYGRTYASHERATDADGNELKPSVKEEYGKIIKTNPNQKDKYVVINKIPHYKMENSMFFPRMYSNEPRHIQGYYLWGNIDNTDTPPTVGQNLHFFFRYQLDYMYFRYLMWNFSGRQNDIEGTGSLSNGNWITGIGFIDKMLGRGPQNLPPFVKENKGHNTYFAIPFILGLLGIAYQLIKRKEGEKQFIITFVLFFMTGIAIILYLNQQPFEPRERDYAYAGSFYAYCIWIGFGVAFVWDFLKKIVKVKEIPAAAIAFILTLIFVPIRMASQNWNDHDRSDRYAMRDFGKNYLAGCEKNSIIFPEGDNDTFPLWYLQEVEGFRTDVRVCNLSYLQTDWYVDQMRRQAYDSSPLPINWTKDQYTGDRGQGAYILTKNGIENGMLSYFRKKSNNPSMTKADIKFTDYFDPTAYKDTMELGDVLHILKTKAQYIVSNPYGINDGVIIPSCNFKMPVNVKNVDWKKLDAEPQSEMTFGLGDNKNGIYRQEMMVLEMLYNINKDDWKRAIYYTGTLGTPPLDLSKHSNLEGINYRIVPGKPDPDGVNTKVMYDNMMHKYQWGNVFKPNVYVDETIGRMCQSYRIYFRTLILGLINEGNKEKALKALDRCTEVLPGNTIPRGGESLSFADAYYQLGQPVKGKKIADEILYQTQGALDWYSNMSPDDMQSCMYDISPYMDTQVQLLSIFQKYDKAMYKKLFQKTFKYAKTFYMNGLQFRNDPLEMLMRISMTNYQTTKDSLEKKVEMLNMSSINAFSKEVNASLKNQSR